MAKRVSNRARFAALTAIAAVSFVSTPLYSQAPPAAPGQTPPAGGRGRGGRGPVDPNALQSRTIDSVKYVEGETAWPNTQPNPYKDTAWPQLPAGRKLGGISAIAAAPNGHI